MSLSASSLRAVSMMIGTVENCLICWHAPSPSSFGIMRSSKITAYSPWRAMSTAVSPS